MRFRSGQVRLLNRELPQRLDNVGGFEGGRVDGERPVHGVYDGRLDPIGHRQGREAAMVVDHVEARRASVAVDLLEGPRDVVDLVEGALDLIGV